MSSASPSINPPPPSSASVAPSAASTSSPATTNQSSTISPPVPSTASSVSTPSAAAVPGPPFHHHAHLHPPAPIPSSSSSSSAAAAAPPPHHQHLNPTLPSPSAQRQVAEARAALVASIGNMLDSELRGRAAILHANDAAIARQERDVARAAEGLRRDNDRLARVAADAARGVKELGNVQNWAEVLERDFLVLEETLRLVAGEGSGSWSGSSRGSWSGSGEGSREGSVAGRGEGGGRGDRDGDVGMEDPVVQDSGNAERVDKGKAKETDLGDSMDVDMPVLDCLKTAGATADPSAMGNPDVEVPSTAPRLDIPGKELSNTSLEVELRSAMDQPIVEEAALSMGSS